MQVGEPVDDPVDHPCPGIRGCRRLEAVGEVLECFWKAEIRSAQGKHECESQAPEADHAVQVPGQALPSYAAMQCETTAPRLDARPPDHQTCDSKSKHGECAKAVHLPAGGSGEQIVVQIEKIRDEPDAGSHRFAKIAAGPRVEQPIPGHIAAPQPDIYRLIRISRPSEIYKVIARVQARGGLCELLVSQCWSRTLRDDWFWSGCSVKLVPIDDDAAGNADRENVESDGDATP